MDVYVEQSTASHIGEDGFRCPRVKNRRSCCSCRLDRAPSQLSTYFWLWHLDLLSLLGLGLLEAVNSRFPSLDTARSEMGALARRYAKAGDVPPVHWRLYRLYLAPGS